MELFSGSTKYVRKPNLLDEAGKYIGYFGNHAAIIGGKTALSVTLGKLTRSLQAEGVTFEEPLWYGGECTWIHVHQLTETVKQQNPSVLVAVGGGKAIDTVKAISYELRLPMVAIPTIAATCAATTGLSVMYDVEGKFLGNSFKSKAADLILVDTQIITEAPVSFLVAGIGDTLAKWFESSAAAQKQEPNISIRSAVKLAHEVYEVLLDCSNEAVASTQNKQVSRALDNVIDSILLISGSISGYGGNDCRTAAAHAVYSGLTIFPQTHHTYHGMIVAFGILVQLIMEGKPDHEISALIPLYRKIGLPATLKEMGVESLSDEEWTRLGEVTVGIPDMQNMPFTATPEMVIQAIQKADRLGVACPQNSIA